MRDANGDRQNPKASSLQLFDRRRGDAGWLGERFDDGIGPLDDLGLLTVGVLRAGRGHFQRGIEGREVFERP